MRRLWFDSPAVVGVEKMAGGAIDTARELRRWKSDVAGLVPGGMEPRRCWVEGTGLLLPWLSDDMAC
jgi:hypothetical protein